MPCISDHLAANTAGENVKRPFQAIVKVLLISPFDEDHQCLHEVLRHTKWEQYSARTQTGALDFLRTNPTPVAICESILPDGTWKDLLDPFARMEQAPALIVSSRLADEVLWSEALNLGAYNVLAQPFDLKEVVHVVSCAWLNWKRQSEMRPREKSGAFRPASDSRRGNGFANCA